MPVISMFFGIVIKMHYRDHNPPHFHAEYQGFEAFFDIKTGLLVDGTFPKRAQNIIRDWALEHQGELLLNWELARKEELLIRIPGADQP